MFGVRNLLDRNETFSHLILGGCVVRYLKSLADDADTNHERLSILGHSLGIWRMHLYSEHQSVSRHYWLLYERFQSLQLYMEVYR